MQGELGQFTSPLLAPVSSPQNEAELQGNFQLWCSESSHRTCPSPAQPPGTVDRLQSLGWGRVQGLQRGAHPKPGASVSWSSSVVRLSPGISTYEESSLSPGFTEEEEEGR